MKKVILTLISFFCIWLSLANAKTIIIGSHGGQDVYLNELGDLYYPMAMHWNYNVGEVRSAEEVADEKADYVLSNGKEWHGHGVDASIIHYQNQRPDERVYSVVFNETGTITVAHKYLELVYDKGDKIFLVGYSAGGDFIMTLADWMNSKNYPIHLFGLIDPFVLSGDITIPVNVKKVALYHQESDDPGLKGFVQGFNSFIIRGLKTDYFFGHPLLIEGVNHSEIDNSESVWRDLGEKMLAEADEYEPDEELVFLGPPRPTVTEIAEYSYSEDTGIFEVDLEIDQDNDGEDETYEITPDLHITSVKGGLASEDEDDMNNSITENLYPGQCIKVSFVARYINEANQTAKDVDFDWRADQEKNRFDEDDDKLCDEGLEAVDANTKNKKTLNNISLCVSQDGTKITLTGPDGGISSDFKYDQEKGLYIAKLYVIADVEEKGNENGDQDISSEENRDESTEVEITLIPFVPKFTASPKEITGPATIDFTDTSEGTIHNWLWNFGDGNSSNEVNPSHYYKNFGTYTVKMTVNDGNFFADISQKVTIKEPPKPSIRITNPTRTDKWRSSKDHTIRWTWKNLPKNEAIKIEYTCDNKKHWRTIYRGYTNNDGSKKWKMDKSKTKDTKYGYIRILRRSDNSVLGISPRFKIDHASGDPKW